MLEIIKDLLYKVISDIDTGNSNLTEDEELEVLKMLKRYTNKEKRLSKYASCKYLGISRASFDNAIRAGKLPAGKKETGFKELSWNKKDLDRYLHNKKRS